MTWLTRSAGRRSRQCPGCPGCPPGWRPVGRLTPGLGAPGGSAAGGVEELEELRVSCPRRSRTSASSSAIRCSAASKRVRKRTHSGHDAPGGEATSLMGYEDKSCSTRCKRAERLRTTFRTTPPGVGPRALYDHKVREAVLDRILEDGMSVERVIASMGRDFLLNLSDGFVYDCLDWQVRRLDLADHRRWVLDHFSGTLCVDELHLGQMTLLLATDPLNDLPVAFALVASNDQPHMRRFLKNLKTWGLSPAVVVTDGSNLDPTILAKLWPDA